MRNKTLSTLFLLTLASLLFSLQAQDKKAAMADAPVREDHRIVNSTALTWGAGPAALPAGAQAVILEGDPKQPGIFTMRLKLPQGYKIMPHSHPARERVTILTGKAKVGAGDKWDESKMQLLKPGGYFTMPAGHPHYVLTQTPVEVQLTAEGPWTVNYVNPDDDPRKKK